MELRRTRDAALFTRIYEVLIEHVKAHPSSQLEFLAFHLNAAKDDPYRTTEWRFMGCLGMGGKFWCTWESFHVSMYSEDRTPARALAEQAANAALLELYKPPEEEA